MRPSCLPGHRVQKRVGRLDPCQRTTRPARTGLPIAQGVTRPRRLRQPARCPSAAVAADRRARRGAVRGARRPRRRVRRVLQRARVRDLHGTRDRARRHGRRSRGCRARSVRAAAGRASGIIAAGLRLRPRSRTSRCIGSFHGRVDLAIMLRIAGGALSTVVTPGILIVLAWIGVMQLDVALRVSSIVYIVDPRGDRLVRGAPCPPRVVAAAARAGSPGRPGAGGRRAADPRALGLMNLLRS